MKGMSKILRGFTFKPVLLYCEGRGAKEDAPKGRLLGGNMSGQSVRELLDEFLAARRLRPDIEKTTWHNSLRLPPGDQITDQKWLLVAEDYMRLMGFSPLHPYCIWAHDDEAAVHIVASRIAFDGRVYLGKNENLASTRHIQSLERAHGLRLTKGPEYLNPEAAPEALRPVPRARARLKKSELDAAVRTGREPPKLRLQRFIDEAVAGGPSIVEFAERLEAEGVTVRANLAATGTLSGLSFGLEGAVFKGSALGKAFGWQGLQARGVTYEQVRDGASLQRFGTAARTAAVHGGVADAARVVVEQSHRAWADADEVGPGFGRLEPAPAPANAGSGLAYRADSNPSGTDSTSAAGAGRRTGQDRLGSEPIDGRAAAPRSDSGRPAHAAEAGRHEGFGQSADRGVEGQARDIRQALTGDHQAKIEAWRRQAKALGAPTYRVTLIGRTGKADGQRINLGKARDEAQPETLYDADQVEGLIPQLRWRNATGFDVYVTPVDARHHYLVIDDMKCGASQLLANLGHSPCLVQSSSAGNEQAVLKVERLERPDEQALANRLVLELNLQHGDPRFSGAIHPFRMAAFSNKKVDRGNAFTRILHAVPRLCARAAALIQELRQAADNLVAGSRRKRDDDQAEADARRLVQRNRDRLEIEFGRDEDAGQAFRRAAVGVLGWVKLRGLAEDTSRVDYRAAIAMLEAGWSEMQVRAGMLAGSDDLAGRHSDPVDYVERTVCKAGAEVATSASAASARLRLRPSGQ